VSDLAEKMAETISEVHGLNFNSRQGAQSSLHSGASMDWAYLTFGVPSFSIELRGNGYVVPDSEIPLAGEEIYSGLQVLLEEILNARSL